MHYYLPVQPGTLIGRSEELAAASRGMSNGARLLTFTGPAGVGKTRMAVALAEECSDSFTHGAGFVGLASSNGTGSVAEAISRMLGVKEVDDRLLIEVLTDYLRERRMMIVLDNVEHLLPAAAETVDTILSACPEIVVLATSRERLRLRWEHPLVLPPLPLPAPHDDQDLEALSKIPSIALFVERARSVWSGFELTEENASAVTEICRRLDGLPLAIELAAARSNVLSPKEILVRFGPQLPSLGGNAPDAPERHRTLRAAVSWSYDLLSSEEQELFGRLGVFADGWTLEAAEAVGDAEGLGVDILGTLGSLVDKSLVQVKHEENGEVRFGMLETMREYAVEQLRERGDFKLAQEQHNDYFLALAERTAPELRGLQQVRWQALLEREHDNFRAALQWASDTERRDVVMRLAAALSYFWYFQAHIGEGRGWLEHALAYDPGCLASVRVEALTWCAYFAWAQRDLDDAKPKYEEALSLSRGSEDDGSAILPLTFMGKLCWPAGDYDRAADLQEEALALSRKLGDRWREAVVLAELAITRRFQGDREEAQKILEESVALNRELGNSYHLAQVLATLADMAAEHGDSARAAKLFAEGVSLSWSSEHRGMLSYNFSMMTRLVAECGDPEQSARILAAAEGMDVLTGWRRTLLEVSSSEKALDTVRAKLDEARLVTALEAGRTLPLKQIVEEALDVLKNISKQPEPVATSSRNGNTLSDREREVLMLVSEGLSDKRIAQRLFITERTARFHVTSVRTKLRANTRAQAVAIAARRNLI